MWGKEVAESWHVGVNMVSDQDIDGLLQLCFLHFTMLTIHLLYVCHWCAPASAADWFNKSRAMSCHVIVIMHVKGPYLSVARVEHCVLLAGFCLSPYNLHVPNRDVYMIQTNPHNFKRALWKNRYTEQVTLIKDVQ